MIRSRTKLIGNEEKPTQIFYAAEKQNQNKKKITKNGEIKQKTEDI